MPLGELMTGMESRCAKAVSSAEAAERATP